MRRRTKQPVFGSAGTKLIEYTGGPTGVFGPFVTKKIYKFRPGKNPRLVDVRDLTLLTKAAGRKNLRDVNAKPELKPEEPKPKKVQEKPKQLEPVGKPAEEVTNDTE